MNIAQWLFLRKEIAKRIVLGSTLSFLFVALFMMASAPRSFPTGIIVTIPEGASVAEIARLFKEKSIISSSLMFEATVRAFSNEKGMLAGDYYFEKPVSIIDITKKLQTGDYGLKMIRVTVFEGSTTQDMADLFAAYFPEFDKAHFLKLTEGREGYLFPDTYYLLQNASEEKVVELLSKTFNTQIAPLKDDIERSGHTLPEIVTMASIIEKEAAREKDRSLISGVLWKRLDIGMPLQVDAAFLYITDRNTYTLTMDDLGMDSPYNTYKFRGLPPGPICSPGLSSLKAAIAPKTSKYLYYLADRRGNTYYGKTFEEHKRNKRLYLNLN
jgi:UPF0755 protein